MLKAIAECNGEGVVEVVAIPYLNEADGVDKIVARLADESVDIILGPTESGVFERVRRRSLGTSTLVPVISSLVATELPQDEESWFFHLNVDVGQRSLAIANLMRRRGISSVAVIHEDSEFGRGAEAAFRRIMERDPAPDLYRSYPFADLEEAQAAVHDIVRERPEAVGIFAQRWHIANLAESPALQNYRGTPYRPFLFTIIDVRLIKDRLGEAEMHFVSVTRGPNEAGTKRGHRGHRGPELRRHLPGAWSAEPDAPRAI